MHPRFLLASLLANLPVRLISLALNLRIHMHQFVHSLYPQPLLEGLMTLELFNM